MYPRYMFSFLRRRIVNNLNGRQQWNSADFLKIDGVQKQD